MGIVRSITKDTEKKLRILHIGNIANNAYLNAKILNEAGLDCDVLCHSYYHIMACPEWEDADFTGDVGSELLPNWWKVDLHGFRRPRWFAQGPLDGAISYLISRRKRDQRRQMINWYWLEASYFMTRHANLAWVASKLKSFFRLFFVMIPQIPLRVGYKLLRIFLKWVPLFPRLCSEILKDPVHPFLAFKTIREAVSVSRAVDASPLHTAYLQLSALFRQAFPQRSDGLLLDDVNPYIGIVPILKTLLQEYDVIQGYATDPIFAMFSGVRPYIAFEHGTIRSIPFEENAQGRLTALSYRMADGVIITNCDNKVAAERLGFSDYRFIPHPINEKWMQPGIGRSLRDSLHDELGSNFIIFHPSRHHWDAQRHPSWEKGNDLLIRGMARLIHELQLNISAVFVEWGRTLAESKSLIEELGIQKNIKWISPVHSADMARYIDACDLLADQFFLGAFGSTMPRALALEKPAMIYINEEIHDWCFPEMPPVINTRTPDQVYEGLKQAIEDPLWLKDISQRGKIWYEKYHSNSVIRERLILFYRDVLARYPVHA